MPDPYDIVEVQPDWIRGHEEMGSKTKFWYRYEDELWLFKFPQANTGQHWAEKIAEEVASVLGILHAEVELARFQEKRGSVTRSFALAGEVLFHGNQLLEKIVRDYDPEKKFRQSGHTVDNILQALQMVFVNSENAKSARNRIAEYIILDALIGNTDRHHENWGILRRRVGDRWESFVAPSFDHASSLGRELLDERQDRLIAEDRVGWYSERARGAIYWCENERHAPSPLELARRMHRRYADLMTPGLRNLEKLNEQRLSDLVDRVPEGWMTPSERSFAVVLMNYNLEQLQSLAQ